MSNSSLVSFSKMSPNCGNYINGTLVKGRTHSIDTITIHHMAGNYGIESIGEQFAKVARQASSNYGIGTDGRIAQYVDESIRPWTSGSAENDNRAITIEVANDEGAPTWHVSDKAFNSLIELVTDICRRNGIAELRYTGDKSGNMTLHKWFQATACPGPYLESKMPEIAGTVNARLNPPIEPVEKTIYRVQVGAYRVKTNADNMAARLKADGFATYIISNNGIYRVQVGAFTVKANAERAAEQLKKKGYSGFITTASNGTISESTPEKKDVVNVGDKVKCKSGVTKYSNGQSMPKWVQTATLYVRAIEQSGKVFLVSTEPVKEVYTGRVNASDVEKIK